MQTFSINKNAELSGNDELVSSMLSDGFTHKLFIGIVLAIRTLVLK
jgi:hypothetical protein